MIWYLAFVVASQTATVAPNIEAPFSSKQACIKAAEERNRLPEVNTPQAVKAGKMFVCLAVVDTSV